PACGQTEAFESSVVDDRLVLWDDLRNGCHSVSIGLPFPFEGDDVASPKLIEVVERTVFAVPWHLSDVVGCNGNGLALARPSFDTWPPDRTDAKHCVTGADWLTVHLNLTNRNGRRLSTLGWRNQGQPCCRYRGKKY